MPKTIDKNRHLKKDALLTALENSLGVVTTACKSVEVGRSTFYKWLNEDEAFKKAVDDIENIALDEVESELFKQIKGGNTTATIFYLKTKGKKRGYTERNEIEVIKDEVDLSGITDDDLKKYISSYDKAQQN